MKLLESFVLGILSIPLFLISLFIKLILFDIPEVSKKIFAIIRGPVPLSKITEKPVKYLMEWMVIGGTISNERFLVPKNMPIFFPNGDYYTKENIGRLEKELEVGLKIRMHQLEGKPIEELKKEQESAAMRFAYKLSDNQGCEVYVASSKPWLKRGNRSFFKGYFF
ncbi:MAG: hypothetical protein ACOX6Q_03920 [Candidatus Dojkabacteria bacterium]|jgi:hypothetical protein